MERVSSSEHSTERKGTSLKELIPFAEKAKNGSPGAGISERVYWLSDAIETETFWLGLNKHLAEDVQKRQSAGGVFTRKAGQKYAGPYTWDQVFSSLDNFLKHFDARATEFLFRDFQPENGSRDLARFISATRDLAVDKFPRLRIIYWEDYEQMLESTSFWRAFSTELGKLNQPVAPNAFFGWPHKTKRGRKEQADMTATLGSVFKRQFGLAQGQLGKRARLLEHHNFAQIVKDHFDQDPRTFLLNYTSKSPDTNLKQSIEYTKQQIQRKILPVKEVSDPMVKMDNNEFRELVESEKFWLSLVTDIQKHTDSPNQAYSLSYFLRFYDSQENDIIYGRAGNYTRLATAFLTTTSTSNLRRRLLKPSQKLAHHLMWEFEPNDNLKPHVTRAKELCTEMFPQDCLYVDLQTPQFWERLKDDLQETIGTHTLPSFLRYFSRENPGCDRRRHQKGSARYQKFLHRAYHEQKEFMQLVSQLKIHVPDYKNGLVELFWKLAPKRIKPILEQKLSKDYNPQVKQNRTRQAQLLQEAKGIISSINTSKDKESQLEFPSKKEASEFRNKLWSASRNLKINIRSKIQGATLYVEIGNRFTFSKKDRQEFETQVKKLRQQGLTNKEIAKRFEVEDYIIEHTAQKLAKKGDLKLRKTVTKA